MMIHDEESFNVSLVPITFYSPEILIFMVEEGQTEKEKIAVKGARQMEAQPIYSR